MTIDDRTSNRSLTQPNGANQLADDVLRLRSAFAAIDTDLANLLASVALKASAVHTHTIGQVDGLQAALDAKADAGGGGGTYAPLDSPSFSGAPTVPTPASADSTSRIANTSWVQAALSTGLATKSNVGHTHTAGSISGLHAVATSGSYNDLSGRPTLGDAAAKNTGTSSGTLAAGDDSRFSKITHNDKTSGYTLAAGDAGKAIWITSGGITVNPSVFSGDEVVTIINESDSSQTITQGTSMTLRQAGTTVNGNRTLAARGIATIVFRAHNIAYVAGDIS